ncbi:MAG TPA: DciA family protein [Bacteroidales bacterium]|jgi:hypothetical protein|nr:DUF721 domain-containing protein [Bacteroidales bacterium]HNW67538.1 DciA family protein [Bacteroidales bacterium]HPT51820.1 DciA family protein [Bacteroidales bacterium]
MDTHLNDIIQSFIKKNHKEQLYNEHRAIVLFDTLIPPIFKANVTNVHVKNEILFVKTNNASLKFDLLTHRSDIIKHINNEIGLEVIKDIILQ